MTIQKIKTLAACGIALAAGVGMAAADRTDDKAASTIIQLKALDDFRAEAMRKPERAYGSYFSEDVRVSWKRKVSDGLSDTLMSDFFMGAVVMPGPTGKDEGLGALYNPWWDGLLLFKLKTVVGGKPQTDVARISEFYLLSGETFRGEASETESNEVAYRTVVAEKDPLSVELWKVMSATQKRFESLFPCEGRVSYGKFAPVLMKLDPDQEMKRLQVRGGLRLKFTKMLLDNPAAVGKATVFTGLVRDGNHAQLFSYFRDKNCFGLLETLSELPPLFRKDFIPYGYVPTTQGTQYLFVNRRVPRIYATVAVPTDVKSRPASLEWYDLAQSEKLLAAWRNNGKEASK